VWRDRRKWLLIVGVTLAGLVKARFAWIPVWYLTLAVAAPAVAWWAARQRGAPAGKRWATVVVAATVTVALLPVPWLVADGGSAPGNAWRLDGRLTIEGHTIDAEGQWYWLTVGRPPTVAEVVWATVSGSPTSKITTMASGPLRQRARWSEPAAAVVGLARGGWPVGTRVEAHVRGPADERMPEAVVIVALDEREFRSPSEWSDAVDELDAGPHEFTTDDGTRYRFDGPALPYRGVETVVVPTRHVDVFVGGRLARTPLGRWYRNLSTGSSHGLMVALMAYTFASGEELGRGLAIAGTGTIRPDGTVGRIKGLGAKARAARDIGADILLFPLEQRDDLAGFDAGGMQLIGVSTIDAAIGALRAEQASHRAVS